MVSTRSRTPVPQQRQNSKRRSSVTRSPAQRDSVSRSTSPRKLKESKTSDDEEAENPKPATHIVTKANRHQSLLHNKKRDRVSQTQLFSWLLLVSFTLLPVLAYRYLIPAMCNAAHLSFFGSLLHHRQYKSGVEYLCTAVDRKPFLAVQLGFLIIFDAILWLVSVAINSTWLIDPLWTIVPVQVNVFYASHKLSEFGNGSRSSVVTSLIVLWSLRLTTSYMRREKFKLGLREDWRYSEMRSKHSPLTWTLLSFFVVNIAQHILLYSLTFPLLELHKQSADFMNYPELLYAVGAFVAIACVWYVDTQLYEYTQLTGKRKPSVLDEGLWGISRHPNYVLEQLFWWAIGVWSYYWSGDRFALLGAALNTACLFIVTYMVERTMLRKREKKGGVDLAAFEEYRENVPFWLPIFGKGSLPFENIVFKYL